VGKVENKNLEKSWVVAFDEEIGKVLWIFGEGKCSFEIKTFVISIL